MRSAYLDNHNWKTLRMSYAFHFMIIDRMATRFVQPEIKLIITQRKDDFPKRTNCVILHTKYLNHSAYFETFFKTHFNSDEK